jgi:hypothetical protein
MLIRTAVAAGACVAVAAHASGPAIDLADVVGGGNGLGTGAEQGVDPTDGSVALAQRDFHTLPDDQQEYFPVIDLPYIDGVFMPDGGAGPNQITSTGLTSDVFNDTSRAGWDSLWNGANLGGTNLIADNPVPYDSLIGFHVNKGVTFDLDAIEADHPGYQVVRFTTDFGLDSEARDSPGDADFWILLDGVVADSQLGVVYEDGVLQFDVPIPLSARFLTLVTTDADGDINWDDAVMGNPTLALDIPAPGALALLTLPAALAARRRRSVG